MRALMADINVQGHVAILTTVLENEYWKDFWKAFNVSIVTFHDLGLGPATPDDVLWRRCQQEQIILLTANRNALGAHSLESTIRNENTPQSLPVFTIASADDILRSTAYAGRVVERLLEYLLEYLLDIDNYRGTGRLYLP